MSSSQEPSTLWDHLAVGGITVVILGLVPLLAILGFTLQVVFVVLAPLLVVGTIAYILASPRSRTVVDVHGVAVPFDRYFVEGHVWARTETSGHVLTGIDDFGQRLLGSAQAVETAAVGDTVKEGEVLATLRRNGREVRLRAPFDGTVTRINNLTRKEPSLVNREPYARGWLVELAPQGIHVAPATLVEGKSAVDWMRKEIDRLAALVAGPIPAGASLPDGGEVVASVSDTLDDEVWRRVVSAFFP